MKKIISLVFMFVLIIPIAFFTGCKDDANNASSVRNTVYVVTKATRKTEDETKKYKDGNMRVIFYDNIFQVEIYTETYEDSSKYGKYWGTYSIDENIINFNISGASGYYSDYANVLSKRVSVFKSLRYKSGKLYTEFVENGDIYSFTLEKQ